MAVSKDITSVSLRAVVQTGIEPSGLPIHKNRNFSNIVPETTPNDAMDVLQSIMTLQKHNVYAYEQTDRSDLRGTPE